MSGGTTGFDDGAEGTAVADGSAKRSRLEGILGRSAEEDRKGTWKGTDYRASDEEAHRNAVYSAPFWLRQTMIVFMVQMKLFSKARWTFIALFTALLIPIIMILAGDTVSDLILAFGFSTEYSNTYIAGLLAFLPLFLGLFTSVLCGTQIPREFKDRTAYLNVSLPMSRSSFYFGKYLAGFVLCLGIFMFAYGAAVATAMMEYDTIFSDLLGESLMLTVVAVFAYSSTAFCIGSFMKRGSSLVPFLLMSFVVPLLVLLFCDYYDVWGLSVLPVFLGEAALGLLGAGMTPSIGMVVLPHIDLTNLVPMEVVGVLWGIAFLFIGYVRMKRREM